MAGSSSIESDDTLDAIMRAWPATMRVFLRHRMACVGCPIATFHTVVDAAREYNMATQVLLDEVRVAVSVSGDADEGMGVAQDDPPPPADQDP